MPDLLLSKQLRQQQGPLVSRIRELSDKINNEKRDFTAEEQGEWDRINTEYDGLGKRISIAERTETVEGEQRRPVGDSRVGRDDFDGRKSAGSDGAEEVTESHRAMAFKSWAKRQYDMDLTEEEKRACELTRFSPSRSELAFPLLPTPNALDLRNLVADNNPRVGRRLVQEYRLGTVPASSGGALIPPETLLRTLEVNMLWYGGVRQVADTIRTTSGERISWPTADDTSNTGVQLGESTTIGSTSVDPSLAKVYWNAYKYSSQPILVPYELLQDSAFNLVEIIGQMIGERLGRITNTRFTTGDGADKPKGIVTCASLGKTAASATAIAADELIDLYHNIDVAYRNNMRWMFHDKTLASLRKLKDGNGQYLWVPSIVQGIQPGVPDILFGLPYVINNDMAQIATGNKTVLCGDFSRYKIRTVGTVRMYRLEERYRDVDQDGFIAFIREDGNLLDAGTHPVQYLAQA